MVVVGHGAKQELHELLGVDARLPVRLFLQIGRCRHGVHLDEVRVHYSSPKPAQLNALAYAQGTDIFVAPGQESQLPHEAWHVVQQRQGRTVPLTGSAAAPVDPKLEAEAAEMGARAAGTEA